MGYENNLITHYIISSHRIKSPPTCGTGKTFASIKIAERINGKRILILVPSLNLIAQAIKDWSRNHKKPFSMCVVCSDETVS